MERGHWWFIYLNQKMFASIRLNVMTNEWGSAFFLVDILHFREVLYIFFEGLKVGIGFFHVLSILVSPFLKVFDFVMQLE